MTPEERARLIEDLEMNCVHSQEYAYVIEGKLIKGLIADLRRLDVLEKALASMIGTHGEPCVHYPCDALKLAKQALGDA